MGIDDVWILTLNAGSSSLKFAAYQANTDQQIIAGQIAAIGPSAKMVLNGNSVSIDADNYADAVRAVFKTLLDHSALSPTPAIIGHRIVHGGKLHAAAEISPEVGLEIEAAAALAPLHNPPALAVIDAVNDILPDVRQLACFDTTFHADNPQVATTLPIPKDLRDKGLRRYGFHGLSYASLVRRFHDVTGVPLPHRILAQIGRASCRERV